jgi:hypothetical protein
MNGFWTAKFNTPIGTGFGVAFFSDAEVLGGDSGYTYIGKYERSGDNIVANLRITPYGAGMPSVFGPGNQAFDLKITGTVQGNQMAGKGTASHAPGMSFQVSLKKVK